MAICPSAWRRLLPFVLLAAACKQGEPIAGLDPITTGSIAVAVAGLPAASPAAISITNSQGYQRTVTTGQTVTGLAPGTYAVGAVDVTAAGDRYTPSPTSQSIAVLASQTPANVTVAYVLATGRLTVTISGLPAGGNPAVVVNGPAGYARLVNATETLMGLAPGTYTVEAPGVVINGDHYQSVLPTQNVVVGITPGGSTPAAVDYELASGALTVKVSGLPAGASSDVSITGPQGFSAVLVGSRTFNGLTPGSYQIAAADVTVGGVTYQVWPALQSTTVGVAGLASASVVYTSTTGWLMITIGGLPGGVSGNVTVAGPGGYTKSVTANQTLSGLTPGNYTVTAQAVSSGPTLYNPNPGSQSIGVAAGASPSAAVTYVSAGGASSLDLTVNGVYLTQAAQRYDGSVPLVAGRNAYLRVFALANQANGVSPQVRVRLYDGASLVQTYVLPASGSGVPLSPNEGSLASSWNVLVPGALIQPNLRVLADVDPGLVIAESNETDNLFPVSGVPATVDVRALPTFLVRFVPVLQQVNSLQGNVSAGNTEAFLSDLKQLLPVGAYAADVRAPYTTTAPALVSDNANSAWNTILSEVLALKSVDASTRYYYGVVRTSYSSGVAGLGYVGGSARTAIGWDHLPSATGVMAHEVGHNLGRQHAPCGGASSPDPTFPYTGGKIGTWGLDVSTLMPKAPGTYADLMGYCSPEWVSDYNWSAMLAYRQSGPNSAPGDTGGDAPGLLVWGRIGSDGLVLEPAFTLATASGRAPVAGPNRLEILAADGSVLSTVAFATDSVGDLPSGDERQFAFVIPLRGGLERAMAGLRINAGGRTASWTAQPSGADPALEVSRASAEQIQVRWDSARFPMVLVRDARSGDILSFARGGSARIWTPGSDFVFEFSNGVRSMARPGRVLR